MYFWTVPKLWPVVVSVMVIAQLFPEPFVTEAVYQKVKASAPAEDLPKFLMIKRWD